MTVTFGTVQLVPASAAAGDSAQPAAPASGQAPPPADSKDLHSTLQKVHDRARRVRAH